jgi:pimeloyl-ACP methyl ester carboxylesterase
MMERAQHNRNPFDYTKANEVERIFDQLTTLDHDEWAAAFSAAANPYVEAAAEAEAKGDKKAALQNHLHAYGYYRVARYPVMNSLGKKDAYLRSQEQFLAAGKLMDPPIERVEMPFKGRPGEGDTLVGLVRRPAGPGALPVVVSWGGIDSFKEERRMEPYLAAGFATLAIDMPGVADAPIEGSEDAERMFDAVLDWLKTRSDLAGDRVALVGGSTGGYWAAKVAHTHRDRIRGAVDQGGCTHYAFLPDWIEKAQHGEYPYELAETLACAFGMSTFEDWLENAPRFSLLTQGVLDQPCAPLLLINGLHDSVFPIQDHYLLLEHGDAKSARFFDVGHMGHTPQTNSIIVGWLTARLRG